MKEEYSNINQQPIFNHLDLPYQKHSILMKKAIGSQKEMKDKE